MNVIIFKILGFLYGPLTVSAVAINLFNFVGVMIYYSLISGIYLINSILKEIKSFFADKNKIKLLILLFFIFIVSEVILIINEYSLSLLYFLPLNFHFYLQRYLEWRQKWYDKITIFFLNKKYISSLLLYFHKLLYIISYRLEDIMNFIVKYITATTFALFLSMIANRLHIVTFTFVIFFIILQINFAAVMMDKFYDRNPTYLNNHILGPYFQKRGMKKFVKPILDNPDTAAAITAAVGGALIYKALDIHDTYKNADIAAADREAAERIATADREQADRHHQDEMAKATADREEARLSREQADRHHLDDMAMRQKELETKLNDSQHT